MKPNTTYSMLLSVVLLLTTLYQLNAQRNPLPNTRPNSRQGLNVFEAEKNDTTAFQGIDIRVGGDFAMQFQGIDQSNDGDSLLELGTDFNLPSANLNLNVALLDGVNVHLRTYLSSKHHEESWVKGGHIQIDKLDFISPGFLENLMSVINIQIGLDEFNYGDAHFRRSDNACVIFNPFIGNYIMDAFATEAYGQVTLQKKNIIAVLGLTNGKLDQNVVTGDSIDYAPVFFGKVGFDTHDNYELRLRLTGSWYIVRGLDNGTLYQGDRAGTRYHKILLTRESDNPFSGEDFESSFSPRFRQLTALQLNPFLAFRGFEFFGIYELASNSDSEGGGSFTQIGAELLYRFGLRHQFYLGGRFNGVKGDRVQDGPELEITRLNIGGGWFLTDNILAKLEYVNQKYEGAGWAGTKYQGAEFSGVNLEAGISF
jgi:hypothetical protein